MMAVAEASESAEQKLLHKWINWTNEENFRLAADAVYQNMQTILHDVADPASIGRCVVLKSPYRRGYC